MNPAKYAEIAFVDKRRRSKVQPPPPLPGIARVTTVKILGVTVTNSLSVAEHVHAVLGSCAKMLFALRVLRAHGMDYAALQNVFRAVVVAKLLYASSAWWGFAAEPDRQRIEAFLRRSARCGFVPAELPTFRKLCREADKKLFDNIENNSSHVLYHLLPPKSDASQHYSLRPRKHSHRLPDHPTHLMDCNYITRLLYSDVY